MDQENTTSPSSTVLSGDWYKATILRRWAAALIDGLILLPVQLVFYFIASSSEDLGWMQYLSSVIFYVYSVYFVWKYGATLGKKWLKIRVVRTDGSNLTLFQAILREVIGKFISSLVLSLGYFWALWDKNRQTWHDKIAGTYVVTKLPNDGKNSKSFIVVFLILVVLMVLLFAFFGYMVWMASQYRGSAV